MNVAEKDIQTYSDCAGQAPFTQWIIALRDRRAVARIKLRLARIRLGNFGDHRYVGQGVWELKIDYGPGYRVYFGLAGKQLVLLLCGGDKNSQTRDIRNAQDFWKDYEKQKNES